MTIFIIQGCYTAEAVRGMIDTPDDREAMVKKLIKAVGGKLLAYYMTFGEFDFLIICQAPSEGALLSALAAAAAGGSVGGLRTTVALSGKSAMKAFAEAKGVMASFRSAGQA
jgi:uncharacterized protein with GYD domain